MSASDHKQRSSDAIYNVPNSLSVARGLAGPLVLALIVNAPRSDMLVAALVLMIAAEISDFVDGMIARRFGLTSRLGAAIDPICDSIYHLSVFLAFLAQGWMPPWMLFVIYARDLIIPYMRTFARQNGADLGVRSSGKVKTAVHAAVQIGVVASMILTGGEVSQTTVGVLLWIAVAASLYSLLDYAVQTWKTIPE